MAKEEQIMINYNKLKLAHELGEKIAKANINYRCDIVVSYEYEEDGAAFVVDINNNGEPYFWWSCDTIDSLISKLQELTKPKSKYQIGDQVWHVSGDDIDSFLIEDMTGDPIKLWAHGGCIYEEKCYPSKETLIDAQIEYWNKMNCEDGRHVYGNDSLECMHCDYVNTFKCNQQSVSSYNPYLPAPYGVNVHSSGFGIFFGYVLAVMAVGFLIWIMVLITMAINNSSKRNRW